MQPSAGRDGRGGGNNSRSMNSGFPAFPDPFAGFGGRPGFLSDMFENDPFFSDPFFTRPFGAPFGSSGIFGPSGFFNQGLFHQPGMVQGQQVQGNLLDQRPYSSNATKKGKKKMKTDDSGDAVMPGNRRNIHIEDGSRRGVQIEELPDDHDVLGSGHPSSSQEPIIEHPDDDDKIDTFHHQPRARHSDTIRRESSGPLQTTNNPVRSYSFQSSSVVMGGGNGSYYASQTTRRQGPNGVIEEEHQEKDSSSGNAMHRLSHGLRDKGRSVTRKRNAEGREEKLETLHNLGEEEVEDFERGWEATAEKSLPKWNKSSSQRLGSSSRARPALPSNVHSRSNEL